MKSLILKDLYNIGHNSKSMLFMLLVFAAIFIPSGGPEAYIVTSGILCSMMVITTFSFDDNSKWVKYAMIMPVTRKDLVAGKFIVLLIFSAIGAVSGLVIGYIGGIIFGKVDYTDPIRTVTLFGVTIISLAIAITVGGTSIPLLFKFGAEKARTLSLLCTIIPAVICLAVYETLHRLGVSFTDNTIFILLCCSPVIALLWNLVMYKISYMIFSKKELLY